MKHSQIKEHIQLVLNLIRIQLLSIILTMIIILILLLRVPEQTIYIGIFLGYGNGTFADQRIFPTGSSRPLFIITSDFNNDNRSDIAVANYGTDSVGIFLGYGDGSFQIQTAYSTGYDSLPYSLAVGDFDKDDHLDIAVANTGTDNVGILLGYGNMTLTVYTISFTLSYRHILKCKKSGPGITDSLKMHINRRENTEIT
jgi:hypothetical protein